MITELKSIIGTVEHPNSTFSSSSMSIASLPDQTKGQKIQITLSDPSIQFTEAQVKDLITTLTGLIESGNNTL